jgi:hypothetical protein
MVRFFFSHASFFRSFLLFFYSPLSSWTLSLDINMYIGAKHSTTNLSLA